MYKKQTNKNRHHFSDDYAWVYIYIYISTVNDSRTAREEISQDWI